MKLASTQPRAEDHCDGRRAMKRHGSGTDEHRERRRKSDDISDGEANLRHYLFKLGLPEGFHGAIQSVYESMESRIWMLDNSFSMDVKDSCLMICSENLERIKKEDGASRWIEQLQCVDFHIKMASRAVIPTKFWMINKPHDEAQRYGVCWGDPSKWASERERASRKILKELSTESDSNPLGIEVRKVMKNLESGASHLEEKGKFMTIVVCTQGWPTDENGEVSSAVMKEYINSLRSLSDLPVKVVFRLCTSDEKVMNLYKKLDLDIDYDVLGNYWQAAKEVYRCNPWLNYGIGLHRLREAGLGVGTIDLLDKRALTLNELHIWCANFFVGGKRADSMICHPAKYWDGFLADLQGLLRQEKLVWNPIKNEPCPWIDFSVLNFIYHKNTNRSISPETPCTPRKPMSFAHVQGSQRQRVGINEDSATPMSRRSTSFNCAPGKPPGRRRRITVAEADRPNMCGKSTSFHAIPRRKSDEDTRQACRKGESFHMPNDPKHYPELPFLRGSSSSKFKSVPEDAPQSCRKGELFQMPDEPRHYPEPKLFRRSSGPKFDSVPSKQNGAQSDPPPMYGKSTSFNDMSNKSGLKRSNSEGQKGKTFHVSSEPEFSPEPISSRVNKCGREKPSIRRISTSFNDPLTSSTVIKDELHQILFELKVDGSEKRDLKTIINEWSHEAPKYTKLRPLHMLLFEAPVLLPPYNPLVKHHEYFDKWKTIHRDAFEDNGGNMDQVVQKISKRCKVFLHPDKWPQDLNEDQKFLLQSIWDVFQESALF